MFEAFLGQWQGTSRLYFEGAQGPELASASTLTARLTVRKFLEIRYEWSYEGKPQEGLLLIGADGKTAAWVDSFHQSNDVMFCQGEPLDVRGSYPAPEGPPWGWRMQLALDGATLKLIMHNVEPGAEEQLAVLATYDRP